MLPFRRTLATTTASAPLVNTLVILLACHATIADAQWGVWVTVENSCERTVQVDLNNGNSGTMSRSISPGSSVSFDICRSWCTGFLGSCATYSWGVSADSDSNCANVRSSRSSGSIRICGFDAAGKGDYAEITCSCPSKDPDVSNSRPSSSSNSVSTFTPRPPSGTTTDTPSNPGGSPTAPRKVNAGAIAGAVAGVVAITSAALICVSRNRKNKKASGVDDEETGNAGDNDGNAGDNNGNAGDNDAGGPPEDPGVKPPDEAETLASEGISPTDANDRPTTRPVVIVPVLPTDVNDRPPKVPLV
jgi:ribulose bisphosphate carboxylase small subunit